MNPRRLTLLYLALLAIGILLLLYPVYVIRPFRAQGPRELQAALAVMRFRMAILVAFLVFTVALLVMNRPRRLLAAFCAAALAGIIALANVNIFEKMFHPYGSPTFTAASAAKLDDDEMVLAVGARAYPMRSISYHHIVNDILDGVPIVATY